MKAPESALIEVHELALDGVLGEGEVDHNSSLSASDREKLVLKSRMRKKNSLETPDTELASR